MDSVTRSIRAISSAEYDGMEPGFLDSDLALELEDHREDCWRQANPRSSFCNCLEMELAEKAARREAGYDD